MKQITKNKKGIVFTVLATIIGFLVLVMFFYVFEAPLDQGVDTTRTKVRAVNNLFLQIQDISRAQAISSSKVSIENMIYEMHERTSFMSDFDEQFVSCLTNGFYTFNEDTVTCENEAYLKQIIEENLTSFIKQNIGLEAVLELSDIKLVQTDPWRLNISFSLKIEIVEERFGWNSTLRLSESFIITELKDPVEAVMNSSQLSSVNLPWEDVTRIGRDSEFKKVTDDWKEKPSTLNRFVMEKKFFENHTIGVSYLNRLRGNFTPDEHGIIRVVPTLYQGENELRSGSSNIDLYYYLDKHGSVPHGKYFFTRGPDAIEVLGISLVDPALKKTIHNAIVPVSMAVATNTSNEDYFILD